MAVTSVKLRALRTSHTSGSITEHTLSWRVIMDNAGDGSAVALTATDGVTSIPSVGDPHPSAPVATLRDKEAKPEGDSLYVYIVEGKYSDEVDLGFTDPGTHPLDRTPQVSWDHEEYQEEFSRDESSPKKAVANSAGEPFDNSLLRDAASLVITIVRNEADYDAAEDDKYKNNLNTDPVVIDGTVFPPDTLKLSPIKADKESEIYAGALVTYYRKTYSLKYQKEGWNRNILDVGYSELVGGQRVDILTEYGVRVAKPYRLHNGVKKANSNDDPDILTFKPYPRRSFAPLMFA